MKKDFTLTVHVSDQFIIVATRLRRYFSKEFLCGCPLIGDGCFRERFVVFTPGLQANRPLRGSYTTSLAI